MLSAGCLPGQHIRERFFAKFRRLHSQCNSGLVLQGDLALLATPGTRGLPIGHITAHNADHALNIEFAVALQEACSEQDYVDAAPQLLHESSEEEEEQQQQQQEQTA